MSHLFQFRIDRQYERRRVDDFFASQFGLLSRMRIANLIEAGACRVNGTPARAGHRLTAGDLVEVTLEEGAPTAMFPEPIPLEIVHEDEQVLVVVKPSGMLVHPTIGVKTRTLANALAYHLNRPAIDEHVSTNDHRSWSVNPQPLVRPGLVHRLDRATSGLMVIAKTPRSLAVLSRHFRRRLVEKRYVGLAWGRVEREAGTINAAIGRDPDQQPRWRVLESGKPAQTGFTVLKRGPRTTLLELEPVTGRTNQLRIHCAHIGHPIVGDQLHGNESQTSGCHIEAGHLRLCLHASRLAFHHPATGEWMQFSSALPADFAEIADKLC